MAPIETKGAFVTSGFLHHLFSWILSSVYGLFNEALSTAEIS